MTRLDVLYEDNHLLVVDKPAGIATMGAQSGPTIHGLAGDYIKHKYAKPGRAYVGLVSRLDTMTSGVLVLARTSKAAARLSQQFAAKSNPEVTKIYLAVVAGALRPAVATLVDRVRKDEQAQRMRVVDDDDESSQQAQLRYAVVGGDDQHSVVAVKLITGRKHQIRVQFADRDHPVVGDRKYGSSEKFANGIALHSWRLRIRHPTKQQPIWFEALPPKSWQRFGRWMPALDQLRKQIVEPLELVEDAS